MHVEFIEHKLHIQATHRIGASLCAPLDASNNTYPAVLFIAGSGKVDRDVNVPQLKTNIFKYMADFFAQQGIISLRYDKRGCGESTGDYYEAGISDYIEDAVAALKYLKSLPHVNTKKIIILGHSEGAFIAPAVNEIEPANGLILLCAGIEPGKKLLPVQPQRMAHEIKSQPGFKGSILRLFRLDKFIVWQFQRTLERCLKTKRNSIRLAFLIKFNAKWLREFYDFSIAEHLHSVACPSLVIGGTKDVQINPQDAYRIADKIQHSQAYVIENMNHLLRDFSGEASLLECIKQYKLCVAQPLSKELLRVLSNWLMQVMLTLDRIS